MRHQLLRRRHARSARRGFTLVELMVAVTGGLFVSIAVFVLAKHSTGFYQSEARMGNATYAGIVGFNRLKADLARAGFLVTPNVRRDPAVCGDVTTWPQGGIGSLASVRITTGDAPIGVLTDNARQPDTLTLAGSYASNDQFETAAVFQGGGGHVVHLRPNGPGLARLDYLAADANQQAVILTSVFPAGRILRVVDKTGREQYGVIVGTTPGPQPQVTVAAGSPSFLYRVGNQAGMCGFNDHGVGSLANVVNLIQYALRDSAVLSGPTGLVTTAYDRAVRPVRGAPTDTGRTELVRQELDATGTPIVGTEEIVAEFAVDLKFGITAAQNITPGLNGLPNQTGIVTLPPGDARIATTWAGDVATLPAGIQPPGTPGPQLIRSVRARLSVRSREADRTGDVAGTGTRMASVALYRFQLPGGGDSLPRFARVRTLQADVALRNQMGVMW
jgi:hypothetical protein